MQYILSFLEGIITFISPCLLPMLPIYISYFLGGKKKGLINAFAFVLGFSVVFLTLGAFAGTLGVFLKKYSTFVNITTGLIVVLFGLNFLEIIKIPFLNVTKKMQLEVSNKGFFATFVFGIIFSIGWTPCMGAFLGSALMLAAQSGSSLKGILMLLCFSLGLGIPFIISAILIDKLKSGFAFIKRNYRIVNSISGWFLVIIGILMATGFMGYFLSLLSF